MLHMPPTSDIIPRHVAVMVGCGNFPTGRYYVLLKDGQLLVIQATPCYEPGLTTFDEATIQHLSRAYENGVEIIQSLLNVVEFGRSNWAYLIKQGGTYRLVYRDVPVRRLSCPTWAPMVEECDVEITQWVSGEVRHGIWKGREVDLLVAWGDEYALTIENNTRGHRLLLGLDLTYEVLGHIVRDGQVVGLMTEPAFGRLVEYRDRALVYNAFAKLQSHGILYEETQHAPNIMISDGKVRFLQTVNMRRLPPAELANEAEYWHWKTLDDSFEEMREKPNFYAGTRHRYVPQHVKIIPKLPSPQCSLMPDCYVFILKLNIVLGETPSPDEADSPRSQKRSQGRMCRTFHLATSGSPRNSNNRLKSEGREDDPPLDAALARFSRGRSVMHKFHPYGRVSHVKRDVAWQDGSASGISIVEEWYECYCFVSAGRFHKYSR